jgi:hypothetical protein
MEIDYVLIYELEHFKDAETIHDVSSLLGVYRSSFASYRETGNREFLDLAHDCEIDLRKLLTRLRIRYL